MIQVFDAFLFTLSALAGVAFIVLRSTLVEKWRTAAVSHQDASDDELAVAELWQRVSSTMLLFGFGSFAVPILIISVIILRTNGS